VALRFRLRGGTTEAGKVNAALPAEARWGSVSGRRACAAHDCDNQAGVGSMFFVRPNVRAKRVTTAGRQARAGENVPRTARPGLVACRWRSA